MIRVCLGEDVIVNDVLYTAGTIIYLSSKAIEASITDSMSPSSESVKRRGRPRKDSQGEETIHGGGI